MVKFDLPIDVILDFMHGQCQPFAMSLRDRMKKDKIKSKLVYTSNNDHSFMHVMVVYKNQYIDITGIHTIEEVHENHKKYYKTTDPELFICELINNDINSLWYITPPDIKYANKWSEIVYNSDEMVNLLKLSKNKKINVLDK